MKKCPFCAEMIQDEAIKCRFCGEFLVAEQYRPASYKPVQERAPAASAPAKKWYHSTVAIVVGFCIVGPFVIPLVWKNPSYSQRTKVVVTSLIVVLTIAILVFFIWFMVWQLQYIMRSLKGTGIGI